MSSPTPLLPLRQDSASKLIPWTTGLVTFALLILGFCLSLHQAFIRETLSHRPPQFTVEIPFEESQLPGIEKQILQKIQSVKDIHRARLVPFSKIKRLLETFLKEKHPYIPYPLLVHVWSNQPSHLVIPQITKKLSRLSLAPHYLVHKKIAKPERFWQDAIYLISLTIFALLSFCVMMILTFNVRTHLQIHHTILDLLVLMGASSHFIQKQFKAPILRSLGQSLLIAFSCLFFVSWIIYFTLDGWNLTPLVFTRTFFIFFSSISLGVILFVTLTLLAALRWQIQRIISQPKAML